MALRRRLRGSARRGRVRGWPGSVSSLRVRRSVVFLLREQFLGFREIELVLKHGLTILLESVRPLRLERRRSSRCTGYKLGLLREVDRSGFTASRDRRPSVIVGVAEQASLTQEELEVG